MVIEGTEKGAISDENGFFEISEIKPQSYNLTVSYIGYQSKNFIFNEHKNYNQHKTYC